jgi:hypothetical protein
MTGQTTGPCGQPADVPDVQVRRVDTPDGPKVEIAMVSAAYCWRVRSWWSPGFAAYIATEIMAAAEPTAQNANSVKSGEQT